MNFDLVENFYSHFTKNFTSLESKSFCEILPNEENQNFIVIREVQTYYSKFEKSVKSEIQIIIQDISFYESKKIAYEIFNFYKDKSYFYLDENEKIFVTDLKTDVPISLGRVNNDSYQYSLIFNFLIGENINENI